MSELLDKFQRDRWVEGLDSIVEDFMGEFRSDQCSILEEVIEYLKGKPTTAV